MNSVKFVDNGVICGWFYFKEGDYYGDGTRLDAERLKGEMSDISESD